MPQRHVLRLTLLLFCCLPAVMGQDADCDCDSVPISVEIDAPDSVFVGENIRVSATAVGLNLSYAWGWGFAPAVPGVWSDQFASTTFVRLCLPGEWFLHVSVVGESAPGIPGSGTATRRLLVHPVVSHQIQDSDFAEGDWDVTFHDSTIPSGFSYDLSRQADGGHTGPYRRLLEDYPAEVGIADVGFYHRYTGESYDPATQGEIVYLRFRYYRRLTTPSHGPESVAVVPLIEQAGTQYVPQGWFFAARESYMIDRDAGWQLYEPLALTASQWFRVGEVGPELPDYSASGAPLFFGVMTFAGRFEGGEPAEDLRVETSLDDFKVLISAPYSVSDCLADAPDDDLGTNAEPEPEPGLCDDLDFTLQAPGTLLVGDELLLVVALGDAGAQQLEFSSTNGLIGLRDTRGDSKASPTVRVPDLPFDPSFARLGGGAVFDVVSVVGLSAGTDTLTVRIRAVSTADGTTVCVKEESRSITVQPSEP